MDKEQIEELLKSYTDETGVINLEAASEALLEKVSTDGQGQKGTLTLEKIAQMTPEQVNQNWEEIQKVLKGAANE